MTKSETSVNADSLDTGEVLKPHEHQIFDEDFIERLRAYRKAADDRLVEMKAEGLINRRRRDLPKEERQRLMEEFGLSQSLVREQFPEDES